MIGERGRSYLNSRLAGRRRECGLPPYMYFSMMNIGRIELAVIALVGLGYRCRRAAACSARETGNEQRSPRATMYSVPKDDLTRGQLAVAAGWQASKYARSAGKPRKWIGNLVANPRRGVHAGVSSFKEESQSVTSSSTVSRCSWCNGLAGISMLWRSLVWERGIDCRLWGVWKFDHRL